MISSLKALPVGENSCHKGGNNGVIEFFTAIKKKKKNERVMINIEH
jgi:predicted SnoaL-like aldol condensation-catalyzing enzyme